MPRSQDWSDSDDEQGSVDEREGYTSVHLGIPSDRIEDKGDLQDPYVSRIGGTPVRRSRPIPAASSHPCQICANVTWF
jgi:hypothetical protein